MEKWKKRTAQLITSLAFGTSEETAVIPYYPQKTIVNMPEDKYFRRTVPEKHGISSKRLYNMLCEMEAEKRANIHSLMVLRHGEVICECSVDGYDVNLWHISHSMSKTLCGMIIGMLIDDGRLRLDTKLVDIFPDVPYKDKRFTRITIENLLSMSSGVDFGEAGAITENAWTYGFFSANLKFSPGTKFSYNSMNTYILARVVERVSGRSFESFARERLFSALGITNYLWEKSPEGTEKGGWGLYMSVESWAKVGYMFARGGVFEDRRILSEEWVKAMSEARAKVPDMNGNFNYSYQAWTSKKGNEVLFNGMLGQNVWICLDNDILVVMSGGNNELFQESPSLEIIRKYLGGRIKDEINRRDTPLLREKEKNFFECRRWVRPKEKKRSLFYWLGLKPREYYDHAWDYLIGSYAFGNNNVGVLPLVVRAMQNNLNTSLERITIERIGENLYLTLRESGEDYRLKVGLYGYESSVMSFGGEKYILEVMGEAVYTIDGNTEYRIEILLPETSSIRMLKIIKTEDDRITVNLSEVPNNRIIEHLLSRYSGQNSTVSFILDVLERRFGEGIVSRVAEKTFSPSLIGADRSREGYLSIVEEENRRTGEESITVRLIRAVVEKIL